MSSNWPPEIAFSHEGDILVDAGIVTVTKPGVSFDFEKESKVTEGLTDFFRRYDLDHIISYGDRVLGVINGFVICQFVLETMEAVEKGTKKARAITEGVSGEHVVYNNKTDCIVSLIPVGCSSGSIGSLVMPKFQPHRTIPQEKRPAKIGIFVTNLTKFTHESLYKYIEGGEIVCGAAFKIDDSYKHENYLDLTELLRTA